MTDGPPSGSPIEPPNFGTWGWSLLTNDHECAVELWRDGELRLTLLLTDDQAELLLDRPRRSLGELLTADPGRERDRDPDGARRLV